MLNSTLGCLLTLSCLGSHPGQDKVLTPAHVARLRSVAAVAISPDGARVAYTLSVPREPMVDDDGTPWSELHVLELSGTEDRTFVGGKSNVGAIKFSADGRSIYFLEKRAGDKGTSLYAIPLEGGEARRAAHFDTSITAFTLAPDGARAAVIATLPESAAKKRSSEKGFKQEVYEEDFQLPRVFVVRLDDDNANVTPLDLGDSPSQVVWSPSDDRLALALAPTPLVDDEMMNSRVRIVDTENGKVLSQYDNPGKLGPIAWSPDAAWIACVSAADAHDTAAGRLFVAPTLASGSFVDADPSIVGHVEQIAWTDSTHIAFVAAQSVWSTVGVVGVPGTGSKFVQWIGPSGPVMTALSVSADGKQMALIGSMPTYPAECFTSSVGDSSPQRRTRSNPGLEQFSFALQEVVKFKSRDKVTDIEGILIRPLDEKADTRYPLILNVHGGPEACQSNGWLTGYSNPGQMAAARGFAVLHVNYRGSTGRGVQFAKASQGDPAGKEFEDLIDGVDYLVAEGLVDAKRVGVTGGSYGGYATAWLCTHDSERFAAGVMFVGISNKISKVGTTDIPNEEYMVHTRMHPWDDWKLMLDRSPIFHADKCKTPLLILGGKDDPRVNPGQSRELYRALKTLGQTPVRLVQYPGEGHGNRKAAARFDYNLRQLQWLEHYLVGPGGEMPPYEIDYESAAVPR
ncbi:MAG TPA: S9 family peptidase [Planctomycetota bacterium]|nr:S9 family peptidase [Planctomycetota bacterium]